MKKIIIFSLIFSIFGCSDLVDFTEVENPNLSEESVVGQPNSSTIWLSGIERQLSLFLNEIIINAEIASDNYTNDQTFYNQFLDGLAITAQDDDIADIQFDLHRLREMAIFGKNEVGPNDSEYTKSTEADYNFFEGLAYMYAGMYFTGLPATAGGPALSSADNYAEAITLFDKALELETRPEYHLAKARTHYYTGNKAAAVAAAAEALSVGNEFTRFARFDEAEDPDNVMEDALYERGTFDDLQPLPTLDFLDPKYSFNTASEDAPVYYLKSEEALLIQIEAALSDNDLAQAQTLLSTLLGVVNARGVKSVDDSIEGRTHFEEGIRPDSSCVIVNGRSGLVLDRDQGNVDIPNISGTSLTQTEIDALGNTEDALHILYRTRQEIFIAEGIRMADMGIKLVISQVEQLQNGNISDGLGTTPQIPAFIDAVKTQLDEIDYTAGNCEASTVIDVNEILVSNRTDSAVLPFH